jgi:hypothetical protein
VWMWTNGDENGDMTDDQRKDRAACPTIAQTFSPAISQHGETLTVVNLFLFRGHYYALLPAPRVPGDPLTPAVGPDHPALASGIRDRVLQEQIELYAHHLTYADGQSMRDVAGVASGEGGQGGHSRNSSRRSSADLDWGTGLMTGGSGPQSRRGSHSQGTGSAAARSAAALAAGDAAAAAATAAARAGGGAGAAGAATDGRRTSVSGTEDRAGAERDGAGNSAGGGAPEGGHSVSFSSAGTSASGGTAARGAGSGGRGSQAGRGGRGGAAPGAAAAAGGYALRSRGRRLSASSA